MRRSASSVALLLAGLLCLPACRERQDNAPAPAAESSETPASPSDDVPRSDQPVRVLYPAAPGSFVGVTEELAPSMVHLRSRHKVSSGPATLLPGETESNALGSGFIVDRKGHILTSEHLVTSSPDVIAVLHNGDEYPAQVVGRDSKLDLALLKIDARADALHPARLGDSGPLKVGEWVLALGKATASEVTASAGIVSATGLSDRDAIMGSRTNYRSFLRTDARIDASNSGGPLVDTSGAVVGVNSAIANRAGEKRLVVPIDRAKQILPMLERDGVVTRAWLGVFVHPVDNERQRELGLEEQTGALVSDVIAGSPASKAGIRPGDVILEFDRKKVDHRNLPWIASTAAVGQSVPVTIWRGGKASELVLVAEAMPE